MNQDPGPRDLHGAIGGDVKCRMKCFYETQVYGPQDQDFDVISIWRLYLPGVEPGISW